MEGKVERSLNFNPAMITMRDKEQAEEFAEMMDGFYDSFH